MKLQRIWRSALMSYSEVHLWGRGASTVTLRPLAVRGLHQSPCVLLVLTLVTKGVCSEQIEKEKLRTTNTLPILRTRHFRTRRASVNDGLNRAAPGNWSLSGPPLWAPHRLMLLSHSLRHHNSRPAARFATSVSAPSFRVTPGQRPRSCDNAVT